MRRQKENQLAAPDKARSSVKRVKQTSQEELNWNENKRNKIQQTHKQKDERKAKRNIAKPRINKQRIKENKN